MPSVVSRSVAHIQFLSLGHEFFEDFQALLIIPALVRHQIIEADL